MASNDRPSWDEYFMKFAEDASLRATCEARKVGAVMVLDRRMLATGYNGSPPGQPHCTDVGCLIEEGTDRCIRTLHAEQNAIIQAARYGVSTVGATIYTTFRPCHVCARMLAAAGIVRVVCRATYPDDYSREILSAANIEMTSLNDKN